MKPEITMATLLAEYYIFYYSGWKRLMQWRRVYDQRWQQKTHWGKVGSI